MERQLIKDFLQQAANVRPTPRQVSWYAMQSYAFIHFGMNTFTDQEWGTGHEDEAIFNPTSLDCRQWVEAVKTAGMKGMILVCKHHDGFCLWDTKTTVHNVMNSPYGKDIVRQAADACLESGIRFGVYLSPWDRNSAAYGTDAYNDLFCAQLTELLTGYGPVFMVWFDNACGEGPAGRKQIYDFPRYFSLIRNYQPDAVVLNDFGPDVRWCGNEAGNARISEWAVVPEEVCRFGTIQTGPGPLAELGSLSYMFNTQQQIGTMPNILYSKGLVFTPSEINTSIRPGWFWHPQEEPKSVEQLFRIYLTSVGGNACLNLNLPPNREGLIDDRDVARLKELRAYIDEQLGTPIPATWELAEDIYPTQPVYKIHLQKNHKDIKYILLREDIAQGQHVEGFQINAAGQVGLMYPYYQGTTIGNCRICQLQDPYAGQNPLTRMIPDGVDELELRITAARGNVYLKELELF